MKIPIKPNPIDYNISPSDLVLFNKHQERTEKVTKICFVTCFMLTSIILVNLNSEEGLYSLIISSIDQPLNLIANIFWVLGLGLMFCFFQVAFIFPVFLYQKISTVLAKLILFSTYSLEKIKIINKTNYNNKIYCHQKSKYENEVKVFYNRYPDSIKFGEDFSSFIENYNEKETFKKLTKILNEQRRNKKLLEIDNWYKLNGYQFEDEVRKIFQKMGYRAIKTKNSNDGGIDIKLYDSNSNLTIVQCKHHRGKVGPHIARELFGVMISSSSNKGILVCSGGFTVGVYNFVRGKNIELLDIAKIIELHKTTSGEPKLNPNSNFY